MNGTTVIRDEVYPIVEEKMNDPKIVKSYKNNIQKWMEKRAIDLYDIAPLKRMPFNADEVNDFFRSAKIDKNEINNALQGTYYWNMNFNPRAAKDEMTVSMMMIIRYFIMNKKPIEAELSAIYLSFSGKFYPSIHSRKFRFPPDKYRHVMEYVVNNVLTQKFDLKREGSVFGAIRSICRTWLNTYENKMMDPNDEDVADMIQQLHGRIKSFMGNIASEYYRVYSNKDQYLSFSSDSNDEDSFRISDSDSLKAERYVENTMNAVTAKGVDYRLCKMASDSNVKIDEVKSIIESIQSNQDYLLEIRELIGILITTYFAESKDKNVRSINFVTKTIAAKPNSKDTQIIRQKEIIEGWLMESSPQYRKRRSREATKSSYYKSILIYYTLLVNSVNK